MNSVQTKMLELHGNNIVLNHYGIELTTLLIIDGNYEGFPIAFLYSSKTKKLFLNFFKENNESSKFAKFLMLDNYPAYVNAFRQVFDLNTSLLLST